MSDTPKCPDCGLELCRVFNGAGSMLNDDQFASVRAGDWFCVKCKGKRSASGHRYFWNSELRVVESLLGAGDGTTTAAPLGDDEAAATNRAYGLPPDESPARDTVVELIVAQLCALGDLAHQACEATTLDLCDEEAIRDVVRFMTARDSGGRDGVFGEQRREFWEKLGRALCSAAPFPEGGESARLREIESKRILGEAKGFFAAAKTLGSAVSDALSFGDRAGGSFLIREEDADQMQSAHDRYSAIEMDFEASLEEVAALSSTEERPAIRDFRITAGDPASTEEPKS
jgi:hypothetical protein